VPLKSRRVVDEAAFDRHAYEKLRTAGGVDDLPVFLFSTEPAADNATVYSRMFAPGFGIPEDPATGGACGALGSYLVKNKVVTPERAGAMLNLQGVKMGRPSHIHMALGIDAGAVTSVRVGGQSVIAGEGVLYHTSEAKRNRL
jgi:trans-2,3-dihydro-3-hydroxyanthranilate isomerase